MCLGLDVPGIERVPDEVTLSGSSVRGVHPPGEAVVDSLHSRGQAALSELDEEVVVIPEEAPRQCPPAELARGSGVELQEELVLAPAPKERFAEAPARPDVVDPVRIDGRPPRHGSNVACPPPIRDRSSTLVTLPWERI